MVLNDHLFGYFLFVTFNFVSLGKIRCDLVYYYILVHYNLQLNLTTSYFIDYLKRFQSNV